MAMNLLKRIERIRNYLEDKGYKKDIDEDVFIHSIMILEGMGHKKAVEWMHNFHSTGLITIEKWKVNFV